MKFTCDKCSAQYMISDDKIGPSGVKVRCKKCQNVIVVRRPDSSAAAETAKQPEQGAAGAPGADKGLDVELGQAFDVAFGDPPQAAPKPDGGPDLASTQMMGEENAAKVTAGPGASAAAGTTEWYVAVGQAQVGPLPASEVKKKWEAGDIGPDSLVWRPGMGEWSPLSTVGDLASYLAPIPRPSASSARDGVRSGSRGESTPTPAPTAGPEPTWKPVGASALAALADEEIATRTAPEPKSQAPRPVSGSGAKSLMDALPDGGGVDPTGAIPLAIKGLEQTVEKKIERRTSVARGAQAARHRRGVARAVIVTIVVVLLVIGAAGAGAVWYMKEKGGAQLSVGGLGGAAPAATPTPEAAPPAPVPPPPAAVAAATPPAAAQPPSAEPPKAAPPPATEPEPPKSSRGQSSSRRRRETSRSGSRVASAESSSPSPPPAPPSSKKRDLLDFEGGQDDALNDALGKTSSGRSVYVPPARGGGSSGVPNKLSSGDINAAVAGRIDSLRRCVSEQKARDPGASGVLKMRWTISSDGSVREVRCLTSEFAHGAFARCIEGVVKSIKFPRSQTSGQEVTFPFNF